MFSRNTYLEVNLKHLAKNVKTILRTHPNYKYYFGVVKADCYGHTGLQPVKTIIESGCNYLAVATLNEALYIRKSFDDIPILCLGVIPKQYIKACLENNITVTISSLEYLKEILESEDCKNLKVHLKINTGMNRLGVSDNKEVLEAIKLIKNHYINLEGVYTHIYDAQNKEKYLKQIENFKQALEGVNLRQIPIIHVAASEAIVNYTKPEFVNACRLGIIMYGFTTEKALGLLGTARLVSEVIQIHELQKGETLGYNGTFEAKEKTKIAVVPIGYADGIIRKNKGRNVYIHNRPYKIVGNICMDMLFVKIDDKVNTYDEVEILKNNAHIEEVAKYLDTIPYEVLCSISKRVPRVYIE